MAKPRRCASKSGKWTTLNGKRLVSIRPQCRLTAGHRGQHYYEVFRNLKDGPICFWQCRNECTRARICYDGTKPKEK